MTEWLTGLADDAISLAHLHGQEMSEPLFRSLCELKFPHNMTLLPQSELARDAWNTMGNVLSRLTFPISPDTIDNLAAEYAAIYLTGSYGTSPLESVWLDEEHLMCREPMFALRRLYRSAGFVAENWRKLPEDHLATQLSFLSTQLKRLESDIFCADILTEMIDQHLLLWLERFSNQVSAKAQYAFYPALAKLTLAWCLSLKIFLVEWAADSQPDL